MSNLGLDAEFVRKALADPARVEALERTGLLGTGPEEAFDRLTRLAALMVGTPVAFVSFLDGQRQHFKSFSGPGDPENPGVLPHEQSFCRFTVASKQPFVVEDARADPLVQDFPIVTDGIAISYAGIPLVTSEGDAIGTFCVADGEPRCWSAQDLSVLTELARSVMNEVELRLLTRLLSEHNEQLRELDREKNALVAVISHELRAPLTSVLGSVELLQDGETELNLEQATLVRLVERNARRVLRLVEDLLVAARAETGSLHVARTVVDLADVVQDAVESARPRATAGEIGLGLVSTGSALVDGDAHRLGQIIDNLIGNAIKFTPHGGKISVALERSGGRVRLAVADTGIGIPDEEHARVFERFYRAKAARQGLEGTGLGLSIVKALVETHGGSISLRSEPGAGSTFVVELPACQPLAAAA